MRALTIILLCVLNCSSALARPPADDAAAFRELFRELVETNTTLSAGDCTLAAQRVASRLIDAGIPAGDVLVITAPAHPKEGNLVAVLRGSDPVARPMLLLAHLDVVEARRDEWQRDPFTLVEEGGYFYGRGVMDDKAMASVLVDTLLRFRHEGFRPRRDIKLALTCGEETASALNGVDYLLSHHPETLQAEFALNEGGTGRLDAQGRPIALGLQAGEKVYQDYRIEATNAGGHSSRPAPTNAIYALADALIRLRDYQFPLEFNEVTSRYFQVMARIEGGEIGSAIERLRINPLDQLAASRVQRDLIYNSMLHTTCVATMLEGGHAVNALPQRARANVNCRIFPGHSPEEIRDALIRIVGDSGATVTRLEPMGTAAPVPALSRGILGPIEQTAARIWPGVPILPTQLAASTDGRRLNMAGIPTYGLTGMFLDPDGSGVHGLNERIRVRSLMDGREFLYQLIRIYAQQPRLGE